MPDVNPKPSDLLWGAKAIAAEINRPVRATMYLLESGQLPARKVGARWVAHRARLHEALVGETTDAG